MAPKQRQLIKQDFEQALAQFLHYDAEYICLTLRLEKARGIIATRLAPYRSLGRWLEGTFDIHFEDLWSCAGMQKQRATRVLWLESLIKEFS